MGQRRLKFAIAIAILFGTVAWLVAGGIEEGKAYYKTAEEFVKMTPAEQQRRTRLMGDAASIARAGGELTFSVALNGAVVPVVYRGRDPVPDTFKEGASVLVEGALGRDGRFHGEQIQAKCASKYEADPSQAYGSSGAGPG